MELLRSPPLQVETPRAVAGGVDGPGGARPGHVSVGLESGVTREVISKLREHSVKNAKEVAINCDISFETNKQEDQQKK